MKVYVDPVPGTIMSIAMNRVGDALREHAPFGVKIVNHVSEADLQVIHVIGPTPILAPRYAAIQYCWKSILGHDAALWQEFWNKACAVWSYYPDLPISKSARFYLAPLGVDGRMFSPPVSEDRSIGVMTSGYVSRFDSEAIEEVAEAARIAGLSVFHLGPPNVDGMKRRHEETWTSAFNIPDDQLADKYRQTRWVSGLRQREGFELPVIEGLACGARPIVFDRLEMRRWYGDHAVFIRECNGDELIEVLVDIFKNQTPEPVSYSERYQVLKKFDWSTIARGFWEQILGGLR